MLLNRNQARAKVALSVFFYPFISIGLAIPQAQRILSHLLRKQLFFFILFLFLFLLSLCLSLSVWLLLIQPILVLRFNSEICVLLILQQCCQNCLIPVSCIQFIHNNSQLGLRTLVRAATATGVFVVDSPSLKFITYSDIENVRMKCLTSISKMISVFAHSL